MAKGLLLTLFGILLILPATSQIVIRGRLIDSLSRRPIAFANLTLSDGRSGTTSEIEGNFSLSIPPGYTDSIYISHVSYRRRVASLNYLQNHAVISLRPGATQLREVEVSATKLENPAFEIIRKAILHKKENDPASLKSYDYKAYNKFLATMSEPSEKTDSIVAALKIKRDTIKLKRSQRQFLFTDSLARKTDFFLSESVTEKEVLNPGKVKEKLLALKVSGFKSPLFTNVATDYQPFAFYDDNINLLGKDFINPVSKGTFSRYDFLLSDTSYLGKDTVFIIQFQPKHNKLFNGLSGVISICTDGFAIKNVIASSSDSLAQTALRIQQNYKKIEGHWFPIQINTDLDFKNMLLAGRHIIVQHRSYFEDIRINPELSNKEFGDIMIDLSVPKPKENQLILDRYRHNPLTIKEARAYTFMDSAMRKIIWMDRILEAVATQSARLGPVELDLTRISKINNYERLRLGAGLYTSTRFSKWLRFGGYAGYGIRDEKWKYGGEMRFNFNLNKDFYLRFLYSKDIYETGSSHENHEGQQLGSETIRFYVASQFDHIEQYKSEIGFRLMRDVHASLFVSRNEIRPTYAYNLLFNNELINTFLIGETGIAFRYVRKENYMGFQGKKIFLGQQFPVFTLSFVQAAPIANTQNFTYSRVDFASKVQIKHRYGGKTRLFFTSGYLNGLAPYGKLYNGRGASSSSYVVENYFQTMGLYEFTATKYASLFLSHNVGNVLINKKYSKPELLLFHNMGIGQLGNPKVQTGLTLQSFGKGYFESGLGLNNIFRVNYANVAYWGFGGAVFYRYGPYQLPSPSNNLFWRVTFSIGI